MKSWSQTLRKTGRWAQAHAYLVPVLFILLVLLPAYASAGVSDIISLLETITSTLQGDIGEVLNVSQQVNSNVADFHEQFLWPVDAINRTNASLRAAEAQFGSELTQIRAIALNSATLPSPAQLEAVVRSADVANVGQTATTYTKVYGQAPSASDAPSAERNMIDMDDASAIASLKTSVIADQTAARMLGLADNLTQQTTNSAPGSAPILAAQAHIASLETQAFLAKTLAAELRTEATRLAHNNALLKKSAEHAVTLRQDLQQMMRRP